MAWPQALIRAALVALGVVAAISGRPAAAGEIDFALLDVLATANADQKISVIVELDNGFDIANFKRAGVRSERRTALIRELRRRSEASQKPVRELLHARGVADHTVLWAINGLAIEAIPELIRELATRPEVAEVRLDAAMNLAGPKVAAMAEAEWNLEMVGAPDLWARGHSGDGIVVAVLDTGVDALHQDLAGRYRGGDNDWFDPYGERAEPHDTQGHGTQAAGLIVGGDAGGTSIGVAPGAEWIASRVFDDAGQGTVSGIHQAFQWLLDPDGDPATDDAPDVANNSWGFQDNPDECYLEFAEDLELLRAAGIAVVFSAGNGGSASNTSISPANNPGAFPVGGVHENGQILLSSARGPSACGGGTYPALVAPGSGMRTSDLTLGGGFPGSYTGVSGTSFAAPHVSGAIALLLSAHPEATVAQLEQALAESAEDLGEDGPDNDSGYGLLDIVKAEAALAALIGGGGPTTVYTDEAMFLSAISGRTSFQEGFEDDLSWSASRSPGSTASVTTQGVTWTSNHPANEIKTGGGPARTGVWGFYSDPHGDQSVPNPTDFIEDGFTGSSESLLVAVGGWFTGISGSKVQLILDGNEANPIELGLVDSGHSFYGVLVDGSFTTFEFREVEGTLEDQKFIFADDFTFALAVGGGNSPPTGTIVKPAADVTVEAGRPVYFEGSVFDPDGDATTVVWDFGDGVTSTALVPGNHIYTSPGIYSVTFTATDSLGAEDPNPAARSITATEALPAKTGVVAGVADVRGAEGSDWHTDLYVHNASTTHAMVDLYFSPGGGSVSAPVSLTVDSGRTELLEDVVSATFGASGSGAILWRVVAGDADRLLLSANTFNRVDDVRRYGVHVPGIRWDHASAAGTSLYVPALAGLFRSNLGFAADGDCTGVVIRAIDQSGAVREERTISVESYSWQQLNKLFRREFKELLDDPDAVAVADSLHRFEVVGVGGKIVVYSTIIDNLTNDGAYLLGQWPGEKGPKPWLPGAAVTRGVNDSQWRTDVMAFNLEDQAAATDFRFFPSKADNSGDLASRSIDQDLGAGTFLSNILGDLFALAPPAAGSLEVVAAQSLLWMRTYSEELGDGGLMTYGLAVPPFSEQDLVAAGTEGRIFGFTSNDRTRSNLILQNTLADSAGDLLPVSVRIDVIDNQGTVVHQKTYGLRPGEYLQKNDFINRFGLGPIVAGTLRVVLTGGVPEGATGGVAAMVSEVNGADLPGTNDGRLIPASVLEAP
jgi:bacillopeptidase F